MPMATIHKMGDGDVYHIHFLDQRTDPGYGRPGGGGGQHPDHGLPGGGQHPGNRPPGTEHPGNRPPGSGGGGIPDNALPDQPPPQLKPGYTLVLVRGPDGKWKYAALAPGSAPPKPLPEPLPPDAGTKPIDPDAPAPAPTGPR